MEEEGKMHDVAVLAATLSEYMPTNEHVHVITYPLLAGSASSPSPTH
jgi:hypothetical protein